MARGTSRNSNTSSASGRKGRRPAPSSRVSVSSDASSRRQTSVLPTPRGGRWHGDSRRGFLQQLRRPTPVLRNEVSHGQSPGIDWHDFHNFGGRDEHDDASSDSVLIEVIMALDMRDGGSMGCAFFTTSTGVLSLSEDLPLADSNTAEHFIVHVQPTTVLVSARAPEHLLEFLGKQAIPDDKPGEGLTDTAYVWGIAADFTQRIVLQDSLSVPWHPRTSRHPRLMTGSWT